MELDMSHEIARVDSLQSEVAELRRQLIDSQVEINALRCEVTSQYIPWSFGMRALDGCGVIIFLVMLLMLIHLPK
jgi:threonine/homoserine efflux transporter RhtA